MFGVFTRRKKQTDKPAQNKVAGKIVTAIIRMQQRWALFMQRQSEKLSRSRKKYAVIVFCVLTGGYSLYVITESIAGNQTRMMNVTPIKRPQYITRSGDEKLQPSVFITEREYLQIVQFRHYMDSLSKTKKGKMKADSILLARPGLMDSIIHLEKLYHLQQSNK